MSRTENTRPIEVQVSEPSIKFFGGSKPQPIIGGIKGAKAVRDQANRKTRRRDGLLKVVARRLRGDLDDVDLDITPIPADRRQTTRRGAQREPQVA